ncbi:MAG: hypothetical protein KDA84_14360, partial [Planctomycetaceae bacterium]|nr:hypothetical protein [Planctomycetaceae bacterium]
QVADVFPPLVILPWVHQGQDVISVATASDLKLRWSEPLPAGERLMGSPVLIDRSLYLLTTKGAIQQRDLLTGRVLQELVLPEPPNSPLVMQEDQSGALVIGQTAGVYLIHLKGGLRLDDVLLPDFGSEVLSYRGLWNPPFVLLFANHLTDICEVSVFTKLGDTYERVQTDDPKELTGRLRQTPAVFGPFCLVITDKGTETVLGLNDSTPHTPLYQVFRYESGNAEVIQRPEFTAHPKGPFVTAVDNHLQRYRIDPLAKHGSQPRIIEWQHQLDDSESVATQPLQILDQQVIFVTGSPAFQGRKVQSVDLASGKLHWQVELGTPITQWYTADQPANPLQPMRVVAQNQAGYVFQFSIDDRGWKDPVVTKTALNATADWFPDDTSPSIVFCESNPSRLCRNTMSGSTIFEESLVSPTASPVALLKGELHCREKQAKEPQKVPGIWVTYLDESRQFHVKDTSPLAQPPRRVFFAQLEDDIPNQGWNRPLWHRNQAVILSHPEGNLVRVEVLADGILHYTQETQKTRIDRGIVGQPLLVDDRLWIAGKDGFCHLLDATTFESLGKVALSAIPSTGVVKNQRFWIGLTNGRIAVLSGQPQLRLVTEREIAKTRIQHLVADEPHRRVYVSDNLLSLYELDENLTVGRSATLDTALSAAPLVTPSGLIVALSDGSVHRLWQWP